jgi:hypothetical protein
MAGFYLELVDSLNFVLCISGYQGIFFMNPSGDQISKQEEYIYGIGQEFGHPVKYQCIWGRKYIGFSDFIAI